jgi:acyl-[acyl-carrier-protein]-phospholipid O-acyltransferase/long-chain-fatty-acid--[acyl-carrier-protein] ligase
MVSLAAAERIAETAVPKIRHAVVALPDPRRGERLILVTEAHGFDRSRLLEAAHQLGLPEIAVPREVIEIDHMPLLGTGKTDYAAVTRLAEQAMAAAPRETTPAESTALSLVRG